MGRFERAINAAIKSRPQHRPAKKKKAGKKKRTKDA